MTTPTGKQSAAHTPGPWAISRQPYQDEIGFGKIILSNGGKGFYICHIYDNPKALNQVTTDKWHKERVANARLIAAAPGLLEALIWATKQIEILSPYIETKEAQQKYDECVSVIAKAQQEGVS